MHAKNNQSIDIIIIGFRDACSNDQEIKGF